MTEFTKGEWLVEQCDLPITESEYFNINAVSGGCIADTYDKHDAHLISCAPDMYNSINEVSKLRDSNMEDAVQWLLDNTDDLLILLKRARGE